MTELTTKLKISFSPCNRNIIFHFASGNTVTMSVFELAQICCFMSADKMNELIQYGTLDLDLSTDKIVSSYVQGWVAGFDSSSSSSSSTSTLEEVEVEVETKEESEIETKVEEVEIKQELETKLETKVETKLEVEKGFKGIVATTLTGINGCVIVWSPLFFPSGKIAILKKHELKIWEPQGGNPTSSIKDHSVLGIFDYISDRNTSIAGNILTTGNVSTTNENILIRNEKMQLCSWNCITAEKIVIDTEGVKSARVINNIIFAQGKYGLKIYDLTFKLLAYINDTHITCYDVISASQIVAASNITLTILDLITQEYKLITHGHSCTIDTLYVLGEYIASSSLNFTKIWNINTSQCEYTLEGQLGNNPTVLSGNRLVTKDGESLKIWDLVTGAKLSSFKTGTWIYQMYKLSNEDAIIITNVDRNGLKVWNMDTKICNITYDEDFKEVGITKDGRIYVLVQEGLKILA
jgi:hypothetical protein